VEQELQTRVTQVVLDLKVPTTQQVVVVVLVLLESMERQLPRLVVMVVLV
jgi:hypothetical protein